MKKSFYGAALAVACTVALSVPAANAGLLGKSSPAPIDVDASTPAASLGNAWKSTGQRVTTPPGNVIVSNFRVVVLTNVAGSGNATPGFDPDKGSASISAFYTLNGVDKQALQAVTDRAYAQLQDSLKASGYNVLPRSTLDGVQGVEYLNGEGNLAHAQFISHQSGATSGYMFTPTQLPVKLGIGSRVLEEGKGSSDANSKGLFRGIGAGFAAGAAGRGQFVSTEVAQRVGATLLDVTYTVTFASFKGSGQGGGLLGKLSGGGNAATLSSRVTPILVPGATQIQVFRPKMGNNGMIELAAPLIAQGDAFSDLRETTTGKDKAGAVAGAVVSGLMALATGAGGMSIHQTKRYEVDTAASHPAVIAGALEAANRSVPLAIAK